jgi:hypothetical protein
VKRCQKWEYPIGIPNIGEDKNGGDKSLLDRSCN